MSGYQELRDLGVTFRPFDGPKPRNGYRDSPFTASWSQTVELLAAELRHLKATQIVVELALEERHLRIDGIPRADARLVADAVRLSFTSKWGPLRYETGEFQAAYWRRGGLLGWQVNLRAIALSMEALRKVDRYGVSKRGEQYRGWRAIPGHLADPADQIVTREQATEYLAKWDGDVRRALQETHPDKGGDETEFRKVVRAREVLGA